MSIAEIKGRHDSYERAIPTGCFGIESHKDRGELLAMLAKIAELPRHSVTVVIEGYQAQQQWKESESGGWVNAYELQAITGERNER